MRNLPSFGIGLALALSTISSAWADCTYNEAEALNAEVTSRGVTIDRPSDGWTAETGERFEKIKNQLDKVSDQHNAAVSADDQIALNAVCEDYRAILVEIDELAKQLE
jgi:hypothetical protein